MQSTRMHQSRATGLALAALLAAACSSGDSVAPPASNGPNAAPADFRIGVEYSAADVTPGQLVEIGVGLDGSVPADLSALQGTLHFDASRLEYVGLEQGQGAFVMTNAGRDAVRLSATRVPGLQRSAATFVFRVQAPGYLQGLRFDLEEAARSGSDAVIIEAATFGSRQSADTEVSGVDAPRTFQDYMKLATDRGLVRGEGVLARAGDATVYGDVNGTGTVTTGDLVLVAGAVVGNNLVVDTLVARDIALGGNVRPANTADGTLVGFNDPCPLGVTCTAAAPFSIVNAGGVTAADQGAIANFLVGTTGVASQGIGVAIPRSTTTGNRVIISGTLDATRCTATPADCNWTRGNVYELQGRVFVDNGGVLNIESGTRIEGLTSGQSGSPLIVGRQGQIFARGERTAPIVFTCTATTKSKGCWGGLAILGNAPLNESNSAIAPVNDPIRNPGGAGLSRVLEGTTDQVYGGGNATDNSGLLRFVRIEYAGNVLAANNELNGLTLGGVGSGTTIEYIQIHGGLDDGYELFGGTVNARYLYITGNSDDAFDWSFGWQGAAQFVIIQQDSLDAEKGLEADNTETVATYGNTPRANGPLYNFTVIGTLYPASTSGNVIGTTPNNVNDAVHIRRGNGSSLANSIIIGFPAILDLDDAATCANGAADPEIRNSFIGGFVSLGNGDGSDPLCQRGATEADVLNNAAVANTIGSADPAVAGAVLRRPWDVLAPDFRPREGASPATAGALPAVNPLGFLVPTTYVGAVEPETANTRNNLPWYAGWTRGFQSAVAP